MKYPLKRVVVKTFSIPTGILGVVQDNLFLSQLPTRLVVDDNAAFNRRYIKNPFNFKHFGLNFLSLFLEGKQMRAKPLTPNYNQGMYARSYFNLFAGTGLAQCSDGDNTIAYEDFPRGYVLYVFDLTPSALDGDQVELLKSGSLRLELKFEQALTEPVVEVALAELDSLLEIDRSRHVLTDFTTK